MGMTARMMSLTAWGALMIIGGIARALAVPEPAANGCGAGRRRRREHGEADI